MGSRGFADFALAPAGDDRCALGDDLSFEQGAALPLNYLTALHGLEDRARLQSGETLLVHGARGRRRPRGRADRPGAGCTSHRRRVDTGKTRALRWNMEPMPRSTLIRRGWRDRLKAQLDGAPLGVVFDPVCGPLFEPGFRSLGWGGRHLVVGFAGGPIPALPANLRLMKGAAQVGVDLRQFIALRGGEGARTPPDPRALDSGKASVAAGRPGVRMGCSSARR